jgi:hypothetical protein
MLTSDHGGHHNVFQSTMVIFDSTFASIHTHFLFGVHRDGSYAFATAV